MVKRNWLAAALALGVSACGQPAFEEGFHAEFRQSATEACVKAATNKGAPPAKIGPYCTCFVAQFDDLTAQQKMSLGTDSPKIQAAAATCRLKVFGPDPA